MMNTSTTIALCPSQVKRKQVTAQFYRDVAAGLSARPKRLDSKYFYDAAGDRLFQQIMQCPEYYPTRCEMEIITQQNRQIVQCIREHLPAFDVVELGAGDATKSIHLLRRLLDEGLQYTYYPVDISRNVIDQLEQALPARLPGLQVQGLNGEYMDMLQEAAARSHRNKLVLFMGGNIGNFTPEEALAFCRSIREHLQPGDLLLTGFDLKKHPQLVLDAYNDRQGLTRAFNLNLLHRINRELDADFRPEQFDHFPVYDPVTGACKSYLVSKQQQEVHIGRHISIGFEANEPIYMEISQKYSLHETEQMARAAGFTPVQCFLDQQQWFADCLWKC